MFGRSWSPAALCQVSSPTRCTVTSILSSVDHLLLCLLCRFATVGVHSAAKPCLVTVEDYTTLGNSFTKDRTQLLQLVQMQKSLNLWSETPDSECNSSDSDDKNCYVVGDALTHCSCLGPDRDVYDLSGICKHLDFSGKTFSHHQKRSCYPAHVHVSARHDRSAQARQHKEIARSLYPQFVTGCLELKGRSNSWIDYRNTKTHPHRNSASRPLHISSPKLISETFSSMQLSNRQVWQRERKGISKGKKLHRKKQEEDFGTEGCENACLWIKDSWLQLWTAAEFSSCAKQKVSMSWWTVFTVFAVWTVSSWHGVDHKIMQKITANMQETFSVTHFFHQSFCMRPICFFLTTG